METPLQIAFHNMDSSPAIETAIRERVAKLEQFYDRITRCRVTFDAPHQHKTHGKRYQVRIDIALPDGAEVVVDRNHEKDGGHEDPQVAIRDAFGAAERQIKAFAAQHRRGKAARHSR
ncbi:MAG: HPF/RaiA family ribosome-associated protein [Alphaproteobacteria bacterium]